jgi:hypothetical protein
MFLRVRTGEAIEQFLKSYSIEPEKIELVVYEEASPSIMDMNVH